jgi:hypothetical protein
MMSVGSTGIQETQLSYRGSSGRTGTCPTRRQRRWGINNVCIITSISTDSHNGELETSEDVLSKTSEASSSWS